MRAPADDTIAALATAAGASAIAVVRISGPDSRAIVGRVIGQMPAPRAAELCVLRDGAGREIDRGLALFFPAPHSYTGEDLIELQCHGSPIVVAWLLETLYAYGARAAGPGEFTQRAFLNDKLDLAQAEAIADLITAGSRLAAQAALRSLAGEFSMRVTSAQQKLTELRVLCEAWLDFPEDDLDAGAQAELAARASALAAELGAIEEHAAQGVVLHDGLRLAIAGQPNVGKSSLLNRLAGYDAAIVTDVPGTTRDTIRERLSLGGIPLEIVDTAGLRATHDPVEREGVRRARREIDVADHVLWIADIREGLDTALAAAAAALPTDAPFTVVLNKADLVDAKAGPRSAGTTPVLEISALTGEGLRELVQHLRTLAGWNESIDGTFSARQRHVDALRRARAHLAHATPELESRLEVAAEELRGAQAALGEITGEVTSDDLLGRIFATFCIGK
ncbi:MAG TPA: tRNA uridine-5-carboxymethylaminomethyl(34) synthesis GTPase MnmE [Gammaproteobacteria bacterium]